MGSTPTGISGSRGAAVLGLSQYKTPLDTWLEIQEERTPGFCEAHGYDKPEREENAPMLWGLAFEDWIIELACRARNEHITGREELHKYNDFITCHIDGRYDPLTKLHEGKSTNEFTFKAKWGEPGTNKIPTEYQIQVQHQMLCTAIDKTIVSVLVFPKSVTDWADNGIVPDATLAAQWAPILYAMGYFYQYEIEASPKLHELLIARYSEFWERYIIGETEPAPMTIEDIKKLVPEPKGTIVATAGIERLSAEYKDINAEIGRVMKRKDQIKTMILKYIYNQADRPVDDDSVDKWRLVSRDGKKLHTYGPKGFR